jgi:hypothetical protein
MAFRVMAWCYGIHFFKVLQFKIEVNMLRSICCSGRCMESLALYMCVCVCVCVYVCIPYNNSIYYLKKMGFYKKIADKKPFNCHCLSRLYVPIINLVF